MYKTSNLKLFYLLRCLFYYTEMLEIMKDSARRHGYDPAQMGL